MGFLETPSHFELEFQDKNVIDGEGFHEKI